MTLPFNPIRTWVSGAAAALLMATSTFSSVNAEPLVYPRAGVSSEAYRTPPARLSVRSARPLLVQRAQSEPARLESAVGSRPLMIDSSVVTVDHQQSVENVSGQQSQTSVRTELQKLYSEKGGEMPDMRIRSYQQQQPAHLSPAAMNGSYVAPPVAPRREISEPGFLSGLFDFGRSRNTSRSAAVRQPPQEPAPFRPPTYREQSQPRQQQQPQQRQAQARQQQQMNQRPVQRPAMPLPQEQRSVARQQTPAQNAKPKAQIEMQTVTPRYESTQTEGNAFFPSDTSVGGQVAAGESAGITSIKDDLAEFFPGDAAAEQSTPAVEAAADGVKSKMQQLLKERESTATAKAEAGFQMPIIAGDGEIVPQPAPAAVSEYVATTVGPSAAPVTLSEPAPFFADEERAVNPQEKMQIVAITGQTFDPSGADSAAAARTAEGASITRMQQIAARNGVGLKGYCPVALRDERRLADGRAAYVSYFQGRTYYLSSLEAKAQFDEHPAAYAPASSGDDVTMKTLTGEVIEGSLDHSVWYKNRLYLFSSAENLKTFMAAPSAMAVAE